MDTTNGDIFQDEETAKWIAAINMNETSVVVGHFTSKSLANDAKRYADEYMKENKTMKPLGSVQEYLDEDSKVDMQALIDSKAAYTYNSKFSIRQWMNKYIHDLDNNGLITSKEETELPSKNETIPNNK